MALKFREVAVNIVKFTFFQGNYKIDICLITYKKKIGSKLVHVYNEHVFNPPISNPVTFEF